jgi:hypothetical protein
MILSKDLEIYTLGLQSLRVEQDQSTGVSETRNGNEADSLTIRATYHCRSKSRLVSHDVNVRTLLDYERIFVLKRICP